MRKILITGASRGIGRKIAEQSFNDGHYISLGLRETEQVSNTKLDPLLNDSNRILIHKYNAIDKDSAIKWIEQTNNSFGSIDTIIHCAGKFYNTELNYAEEREKEIEELWKVNVMAPWFLTKSSWKYLMNSQNPRIITLVSMSGKRSKSNLAGYTTTKFALMGLCQTIRNEGWDKGLRVTAICPGWVNTDMASNVKSISKEEMTQPEDIASIVSTILKLPNTCVPFEVAVNCNHEIL
ncbi:MULTISPECIES: SDR family NAD(P)-dependent oxidoreductase [Prochlorococcus]|uniref:SDR family NAD(P)-dependent oxidoreductase n=1 Tax=Prochlorococcus TaxID=1218 RepID=UPI0005336EFC|nr:MULTISPECIES: SDR family NAD(P)-dependent oxidoreductase [Prochlorococcus]KGG12599.1 Short-chain dehydrogenase/reductase (SDR) :Glucose [Prochlorococcus sp. MIT 0601]